MIFLCYLHLFFLPWASDKNDIAVSKILITIHASYRAQWTVCAPNWFSGFLPGFDETSWIDSWEEHTLLKLWPPSNDKWSLLLLTYVSALITPFHLHNRRLFQQACRALFVAFFVYGYRIYTATMVTPAWTLSRVIQTKYSFLYGFSSCCLLLNTSARPFFHEMITFELGGFHWSRSEEHHVRHCISNLRSWKEQLYCL